MFPRPTSNRLNGKKASEIDPNVSKWFGLPAAAGEMSFVSSSSTTFFEAGGALPSPPKKRLYSMSHSEARPVSKRSLVQ